MNLYTSVFSADFSQLPNVNFHSSLVNNYNLNGHVNKSVVWSTLTSFTHTHRSPLEPGRLLCISRHQASGG